MSSVNSFEDLEAWQRARALAREVYARTANGMSGDRDLKQQLRRASVSIMSNIAEGMGRGGNREFLQFLSIARGSEAEVRSQLYVAYDVGYLNSEQFGKILALSKRTGQVISGLMRHLKKSRHKGSKYGSSEPPDADRTDGGRLPQR